MRLRTALLLSCLALAACQAGNPYTTQSAPIPPAPPIERIQSPTYPAAPRDFSSYQTWSWRSPPAGIGALSGDALQEMVAGTLDQHGLRPAPSGARGALQVSASASTEIRVSHHYDDYGTGTRIGAGRYGGGYGMAGSTPVMRSHEQEVVVVRIELYDTGSGQLVWSNRGEAHSGARLNEREKATREAVERALADYPPR